MSKRASRINKLHNSLEKLQERTTRLELTSNRLSTFRLATFSVSAILVVALLFGTNMLLIVPLITAIALFGYFVIAHTKVKRSLLRTKTLRQIKKSHLARVRLDWAALPSRKFEESSDHPFASDLDLLGENSLHQLLDLATSIGGSNRLRDWLLDTDPTKEKITLKQSLVKELQPLRLFRDRLNLESMLTPKQSNNVDEGQWISEWLKEHEEIPSLSPRLIIASSLLLASYFLLAMSILLNIPQVWIVTFTLYTAIFVFSQATLMPLFAEASTLEKSLRRFRSVFQQIERFSFSNSPRLRDLCSPFMSQAQTPSRALKRLEFIMTGASLRTNSLLWIFANILMPWDLWFGNRFLQEKSTLQTSLPVWLDVWFELEALSSLANFADLNPEYSYPTFETQSSESPVFESKQLGHPLIDHESRVTNNFTINNSGEIAIITGSNMSGKSTFLRTLGINHVLAYAGAPVCAETFQAAIFRLFSCIKVSDSIADGFSYFYVEVHRLRQLLTALQSEDERPLLYFIDEIFRGTNNRERLIGSRSYIKELAKHDGIGLISTHDLELVQLSEGNTKIKNYHFKEEILDNKMSFDYAIQAGPCPTTNALKIMAMEGLPVEPES